MLILSFHFHQYYYSLYWTPWQSDTCVIFIVIIESSACENVKQWTRAAHRTKWFHDFCCLLIHLLLNKYTCRCERCLHIFSVLTPISDGRRLDALMFHKARQPRMYYTFCYRLLSLRNPMGLQYWKPKNLKIKDSWEHAPTLFAAKLHLRHIKT